MQKSYTIDFLTKKTKINKGEVPQFYVSNSHTAIISPEVFDMVQAEIKRRKTSPKLDIFGIEADVSKNADYYCPNITDRKSMLIIFESDKGALHKNRRFK